MAKQTVKVEPEGDDDDLWDDDDDEFLRSTQLVEIELLEKQRLEELKKQNSEPASTGPTMTQNLASHAFNLRRENLRQSKDSDGSTQRPFYTPAGGEDASGQVQNLSKLLAAEKNKNMLLSSQLTAAQGESETLRRKVEIAKHEQQQGMYQVMTKEQQQRQKYDEEKRTLQQEITTLRTQLRAANNEVSKFNSKAAINNSSRSIGGAQSQHPLSKVPSPATARTLTHPIKHRSDPNLHVPVPPNSANVTPPTPTVPPRVPGVNKSVEANDLMMEQEARDELLFSGEAGADKFNITSLKCIESLKHLSVRKETFQKIRELIHLDFENNAKSRLHQIAAKAPQEIMARFTRGVEMKTCFPDFIENMFLYGVQSQQKRDKAMKGEHMQEKYPKSVRTTSLDSGIINMSDFNRSLESYFVYDSAWLALGEIKKQIRVLLSTFVGDGRFMIYQLPNLHALWEILAWTSHLWKFIVFEEEFDDIVARHGKTVWMEELKSWTGVIVKMDWRDYYVQELEILIRGYSLDILELIVTAGYFDSSQRRYEILYCILKDTLLKDHIRNEQFIRKILNIISWSMSDNRNILNYLCINNNDANCLARILGENVLKCFKEMKSSDKATNLLLCYLRLLETLMVTRPPRCYSKMARKTQDLDSTGGIDSENDDDNNTNAPDLDDDAYGESMDVSSCSQFACPEKYKFEAGSYDRAKRYNNVKAASCWINPVEWEVPISETSNHTTTQRCQCRKVLLGSAFIMLYQVVEWWKESFVHSEREVEERRENEEIALQTMKETEPVGEKEKEEWDMTVKALSTKLESLQQLVKEACVGSDKSGNEAEGNKEHTWSELLARWVPPATLTGEGGGFEEKLVPVTIFDLAVQKGLVLMNFCNFHSENIALAAGSEAFNCFTLLTAEIRTFQNHPSMTEVERRLLMEIIKSGEDESEAESRPVVVSTTLTDEEEEDDDWNNSSGVLLLDDDKYDLSLVDDFPEDPKITFVEADFDKAFQAVERERKSKWADKVSWTDL